MKCDSGYSLEGTDVIICIKDEDFRSIDGQLPSCKESKHFLSFMGSLCYRGGISIIYLVQCRETLYKTLTWFLPFSELCTSLPPEISSLTTEETFPVSYNTAVTVSCSGDRELRGDKVITCNQDTEFMFGEKPKCNDIGLWMNHRMKNNEIQIFYLSI